MVGEQGLLQLTISGVDWQNTIEFLVGRKILQVFLVGVKFRLVVQNPCRTLNMRHPVHSCSYKVSTKSHVFQAMKFEHTRLRTRKWQSSLVNQALSSGEARFPDTS